MESSKQEDDHEKTVYERAACLCVKVSHGGAVAEICREMGVSDAAFYKWKQKYAGMGVTELRKMKALEEENRQLKKLVADLSLDKHLMQEVMAKKF